MKKIEIKPNEITINEEGDLKVGDMILKEEEQIPLMKHLYSMEKQRKKYQAKIDDLKYELEKVEKSKLKKEIKKLQEDLKNEKAEKEVFKIEAKAYKEENAQLKDKINKAIYYMKSIAHEPDADMYYEFEDYEEYKKLLSILKGE